MAGAGFGCKTRLSRDFGRRHFAGLHYTWYSKELNPIQNGDSSNPLKIYEMLDRAVKLGDVNHPKVKDLRISLMQAADYVLRRADVVEEIRTAPLAAFEPELWKILTDQRAQKPTTNRDWDEQWVEDLAENEFETVAP